MPDASLMLMRGELSTIVTIPVLLAIFAPLAFVEVDEEGLVRLRRAGRP